MAKLKKTLPKEFADLCYNTPHPWPSEAIEKCKEMLSSCEPDARFRGYYNETALHNCNIPLEIVKWLVERGADVNAPYTYGTPLYKHAGRGNLDICEYLISQGAEIEALDYAGKTPLFAAADKGCVDIVELLLANGADPNYHCTRVESCETPLLYMLSRMNPGADGKADIAKILLNAQGGSDKIPSEDWEKAQKYVRDKGEKFEFAKSGWDEEQREKGESAMKIYYDLFEVEPPKSIVKHDGISPIIVDTSLPIEELHDSLWEYLVPPRGRCETIQGEVIRITGRIGDEVYRNGGINWDKNYRMMLSSLEEFLSHETSLGKDDLDSVKEASLNINNCKACGCEKDVAILQKMAVKWVSLNSTPIQLEEVPYNR